MTKTKLLQYVKQYRPQIEHMEIAQTLVFSLQNHE